MRRLSKFCCLIALAASGSLWVAQQHRPALSTKEAPAQARLPQPTILQPTPRTEVGAYDHTPLQDAITFAQFQQLYRQAQKQLYNSYIGNGYDDARELLLQVRALSSQIKLPERARLYWEARTEFELGNWYQGAVYGEGPGTEHALPYFEKAGELALRLIQMAPDSSEGYRLWGEALMRIISIRGWLHALAHAGRAKDALQHALALDSANAEAHLALGVYYLYAPGLFGGSPTKALASLQQAYQLATDETTRFLAHRWQGVAYAKMGERPKAQESFRRALEIYPDSGWDRQELKKLEGR